MIIDKNNMYSNRGLQCTYSVKRYFNPSWIRFFVNEDVIIIFSTDLFWLLLNIMTSGERKKMATFCIQTKLNESLNNLEYKLQYIRCNWLNYSVVLLAFHKMPSHFILSKFNLLKMSLKCILLLLQLGTKIWIQFVVRHPVFLI